MSVWGPLLTLVMFNPAKSRRELTLDLGIVVLIQLAALAYGLFTVTQARPVYLVFEVDRLRAVTYSDIQHEVLKPEAGGLQVIGWGRPKLIGAREPTPGNGEELLRSLDQSLSGYDPSVRPDWWVPYETVRERVLRRAKPLADLRNKKSPSDLALIDEAVREAGWPESQMVWLPVSSFRSTSWVALLDTTEARIRAFAPVDGF